MGFIRTGAISNRMHYFYYEGRGVSAHLAVLVEEDGTISLSQTFVLVNKRPPQEAIDATRSIMRLVESELERDCSMRGLASDIQEICLGVRCPGET